MAAPTVTTRVTPTGRMLEEGFSIKVAFARDPDVNFWEVAVKPPGVDGGDPIPRSTQHNSAWHTDAPRALKRLTAGSCKARYDPNLYTQILNLINYEDSITVRFPDGSTLAFWGYLKSFEPSELSDGNGPECDIQFVPTNWDPVNNVEAGPVMTEVTGT